MLLNVLVKLVSMAGMTATRARPVAAAIRPYSIAVAPDSSLKKRANITLSLILTDFYSGTNYPLRVSSEPRIKLDATP